MWAGAGVGPPQSLVSSARTPQLKMSCCFVLGLHFPPHVIPCIPHISPFPQNFKAGGPGSHRIGRRGKPQRMKPRHTFFFKPHSPFVQGKLAAISLANLALRALAFARLALARFHGLPLGLCGLHGLHGLHGPCLCPPLPLPAFLLVFVAFIRTAIGVASLRRIVLRLLDSLRGLRRIGLTLVIVLASLPASAAVPERDHRKITVSLDPDSFAMQSAGLMMLPDALGDVLTLILVHWHGEEDHDTSDTSDARTGLKRNGHGFVLISF